MKNRSLIAHETLSWRARARFQKAVARWQTPLRSSISMQTEIIHRAVTHIHHYNLSGASVPDTSISFAHAGSIATSGSSESCALAMQNSAEQWELPKPRLMFINLLRLARCKMSAGSTVASARMQSLISHSPALVFWSRRVVAVYKLRKRS